MIWSTLPWISSLPVPAGPRALARRPTSWQGIYEEILVDEYQDSNEVQETLIRLHLQGAVREAQRVHGGGCEAEHLQIPPGKTGTFYGEI